MALALEEQRHGRPLLKVSGRRIPPGDQGLEERVEIDLARDALHSKGVEEPVDELDIVGALDDQKAILRHVLPHVPSLLAPDPEQELPIDPLGSCFLLGLLQAKNHQIVEVALVLGRERDGVDRFEAVSGRENLDAELARGFDEPCENALK
jgi:hypothetical protein